MAKINWSFALMEYMIDTSMSFAKIAQKYRVAKRTVAERAAKEHWTLLRDVAWAKAHQALNKKQSIPTVVSSQQMNITSWER